MIKTSLLIGGSVAILTLLIVAGFVLWSGEEAGPNVGVHVSSPIDKQFIRLSRERISGMSGKPEETIHIFQEGQVWLEDSKGETVSRGQLTSAELQEIHNLLQGDELINENVRCEGKIIRSDSPSTNFIIWKERKRVTFEVAINCPLPNLLRRLDTMFDIVEVKYLKR